MVDYSLAREEYARDVSRYRDWIQAGNHADMGYLLRGLDRRADPALVFPGLEGVITVLRPYPPEPAGTADLRYARYLNGPDYHDVMKERMEAAFARLRDAHALPGDFRYKICVDTSAVLERAWARISGLGWIGKNTLLIHPKLGSYVFLGVVFTNHRFGAPPVLLKDYCGPCTRCLQACPVNALLPHELDSRKCISYLTIEKRGSWEQAVDTKGFVAGCDLCQEACPYNFKPAKYASPAGLAPHLVIDADSLMRETEEEYRARIAGTALDRIRPADFKRNVRATRSAPRTE